MPRYSVLGPLTVDGQSVSPGQQRTVLAALLVHANQPVTTSSLIDELWPDRAPGSANVIVQMCVSGLRKLLAPGLGARDRAQPLRTSRGSYRLEVCDGDLDQDVFLQLAGDGQRLAAAGEHAAAAEALRAALDHWHGSALHDVAGGAVVSAHAAWLDERRDHVLERRTELDLKLGRHAEVIAELRGRVEAEPTLETFAAQLVTALAAAGRRREAAEVFEHSRTALATELGVRPGKRLLDALRLIDAPVSATGRRQSARAQLPPHIADFTGRRELLERIDRALRGDGAAPAVLALCGPGGIGKSALAVRAAHALRARYPDGQVVAQLGSASTKPVDVLGQFLHALGVDDGELPSCVVERQHLWRSRTAESRVLVLLDDARDEQQVRALLPGGGRCGVLVTSRRRLLGLEGASTIQVPELDGQEAIDLLASLAGPARIAAEPECARRLLELCGGLPLAVRIVGAKLAARPHEPVADLVERIADRHRRLSELRAGDLDVRATVEVSYAECDPAQQRALCLLGDVHLPAFTRWTVATLLDCSEPAAAELVEGLVEAQLVQVVGRDSIGQVRYRLHDLIATFAAEKAGDGPGPDVATDRLLHRYVALARRAHDRLRVSRFPPPVNTEPPRSAPEKAVQADPGGWRHEESRNLVALTWWAYHRGRWDRVCDLADAFSGLAERRPADTGVRDVKVLGLLAARRAGDRRAEAVSLCALGDLRWENRRANSAHRYYALAIRRFAELGDDSGLARVLTAHADVDIELGRISRATTTLRRALLLAELVGDRQCQADALDQLGALMFDIGDCAAARECFTGSHDIAHSLGARQSEARSGKRLADVLTWCGEYQEAARLLQEALKIARDDADQHWEAHVLRSLGELRRETRDFDGAEEALAESLALFTELDHRFARCYTVLMLGSLYAARGDFERAELSFAACRQMFQDLDDWRGQGYTLLAHGKLLVARGQVDAGVPVLRSALGIFERMGYRRVQEVTVTALRQVAASERGA